MKNLLRQYLLLNLFVLAGVFMPANASVQHTSTAISTDLDSSIHDSRVENDEIIAILPSTIHTHQTASGEVVDLDFEEEETEDEDENLISIKPIHYAQLSTSSLHIILSENFESSCKSKAANYFLQLNSRSGDKRYILLSVFRL